MARVGMLSTHSPNSDSRRLRSGTSTTSLGSASRCTIRWQKSSSRGPNPGRTSVPLRPRPPRRAPSYLEIPAKSQAPDLVHPRAGRLSRLNAVDPDYRSLTACGERRGCVSARRLTARYRSRHVAYVDVRRALCGSFRRSVNLARNRRALPANPRQIYADTGPGPRALSQESTPQVGVFDWSSGIGCPISFSPVGRSFRVLVHVNRVRDQDGAADSKRARLVPDVDERLDARAHLHPIVSRALVAATEDRLVLTI